jgi:amidase
MTVQPADRALGHPGRRREPPDELWRWTAVEIASGVRTRQISAREATESCLARIVQTNPTVNALAEVSADEALTMADAADRAVAAGEPLGPLHGVPISIKINTDQAGHATTDGVVAFADNVARVDSPQVAMLRNAGAVFVGRSNTPAFSYRWFTDNDLHGRTRNPWDPTRTPGGSSGGAAASVACGMTPIAHGNDHGGSIRHPAYACGVVGLRPTVGRVPHQHATSGADELLSLQYMAVEGPLARTVADLRLALDAMSGFDPRDAVSVPVPSAASNDPLPRPVRVGLVRDAGVVPPTPAVDRALDTAAAWLGDAGYVVEEITLPLLGEAARLWFLLCMEEFRRLMPIVEQLGNEGMKRAAATYYAAAQRWWGPAPDLGAYIDGYARRGTLARGLQAVMQDHPLLVTPVSAEQAFPDDADIADPESGRRVVAAQWPCVAVPTVGFPAASVPTAVVDGLPIGVQLIGRRFREDTVLDAAEVLEARCGPLTPIEPR